jgi:hypothetical protein
VGHRGTRSSRRQSTWRLGNDLARIAVVEEVLRRSADRHVSTGRGSFMSGARSPEHLRDWGKPRPIAAIRAKTRLTYRLDLAQALPRRGSLLHDAAGEVALMSGHRFEPLGVSTHNMQENQMRKLLVSTVVSLAWVVPAMAQDGPAQGAAASAAHGQRDVVNQSVQSFEQRVQQRLTRAGFSNIEMVPTSILIRAMDRDGNPVMLALSPDSLSELLEVSRGENDGSGSDTPSRHPAAAGPSVGDAK